MPHRRLVLAAGLAAALSPRARADAGVESALRAGGVVVAFRHARAPGTFDPPEFRLGDCSSQRNLDDEGRAQARRMGAWFAQRALSPSRVRSSPWCRCLDTATLAFGGADVWSALGSPRGASESTNEQSLVALRRALGAVATRARGFEVWVTHMFVLQALVNQGAASGEGLVLRAGPQGRVLVLARLPVA